MERWTKGEPKSCYRATQHWILCTSSSPAFQSFGVCYRATLSRHNHAASLSDLVTLLQSMCYVRRPSCECIAYILCSRLHKNPRSPDKKKQKKVVSSPAANSMYIRMCICMCLSYKYEGCVLCCDIPTEGRIQSRFHSDSIQIPS